MSDEPRQRIVIHAGFHKTGTSTVQAVMRQNAKLLYPHMALGVRGKIEPVVAAARGYSTWRDPISLAKAGMRFGQYLDDLDLSPKRQLLVSAEELSGHMAGRGAQGDYSAAPDLMRAYTDELEVRYGKRLQLTFFFSLRQPEAWLRSAYWEHVKSSRMELDEDTFLERYRDGADLERITRDVAKAVAPHGVRTAWLEETKDLPLGPATPVFDLMRLPPAKRAALRPVPRRNIRGPEDMMAIFLEINRSDLSDDEARDRKQALFAKWRDDENQS